MQQESKRRVTGWRVAGFALLAMAAYAAVLMIEPTEPNYEFIKPDHAVDMWDVGKDRWAYFFNEMGKPEDLASRARPELFKLGFKEDASQRPWFRFVKGKEEVIICGQDDFEVNGGGNPQKHRIMPPRAHASSRETQCVLIKNGPGTKGALSGFKIKKLIFGW